MPDSGMIREYIGSNGFAVGVQINGFLVLPPLGGLIMQSPNGTFYMLQIRNDGRLATTPVTL